ncbi:hypothetical protein O3P69_011047 [Scylla paramamosain]|uniref:Chitin-binding type-2 domain-containing protein n=1 Tax=Scylla paramamosain TaxID=85552 RepID=A0AAW0SU05_SCYPA
MGSAPLTSQGHECRGGIKACWRAGWAQRLRLHPLHATHSTLTPSTMRLTLHLLLPAALLAAAAADKGFGGGNGPATSYSAPSANGNGFGGANGNNGFGGNGPANTYSAPSANGFGNGNGNGFGGAPSNTYGPPGGGYGYEDPLAALGDNIPGGGEPGVDYPVLAAVPDTGFSCDAQTVPGYYADAAPEAGCQVFHICQDRPSGRRQQDSFLCPNGTVFNQQYFVCDWWFNFDCSLAEGLYSVNEEVLQAALAAQGQGAYAYPAPGGVNGLGLGGANGGVRNGNGGRNGGANGYGNGGARNGNGNGNGGANGYGANGSGRNGNGAPSTSYGTPSNGNGNGANGFSNGAPSTAYGTPSNGNGRNGNGANGYSNGAPSTSYGTPSNGNGRNGNGAPSTSYGTPSNGNGAPSTSYGAPF